MPTAARKRREEEQQHNRREFATQANDRIWQALTGQPAPGPGPATTSAGFNAAPSPARVGDWGGTPPAAAGIPAAAVPWAAARPAVPAAVQAPRAPSAEYVAGAAQPSPPAVPAMPPPSYEQPRLFMDSDGRARAGFNMGEDGRRLGLVDADAAGVPLGIGMVPVQGLSQGSAEVGRDLRFGPPAPAVLTPPPAPPTTADWARSANAIGGYEAPPMNAREAARMADKDATRAARWDQRGSTTQVDRAVGQIRSQGAALDALTRQTNEQIRLAQGTPQVAGAAGSGVMGWNPQTQRYDMALPPAEQVKQVPLEERLKNVAAAIRSVSGGDVDPLTVMEINNIADPEQKRMAWERVTKGNPELAKQLADYASALLGGPAGTGDGGREPRGGRQGTGAGAQNAQAGAPAVGSAWDKYRRGNR